MARITYIEHDGTPHTVDVPTGTSLMKGAVYNAVPGIDAECGGACACATCHIYIEEGWFDRLPPAEAAEVEMLDFALNTRGNSRLACQIESADALDGLVVRMPETQS
jgi:ferredoxin, 2Fe-2S